MRVEQSVTPGAAGDRLARLQALADPVRLAVVDLLVLGDRSPGDLQQQLAVPGNLLAHHLKVLADAGLVRRVRSEADRRRTYVQLVPAALEGLVPGGTTRHVSRVVFVCTHNSARSQLAAAVWRARSPVPVASGGTRPASRVNPGAVAVARRHGLRLERVRPVHVDEVIEAADLVVSVCDAAHEQLDDAGRPHVHWSVPDPVRVGTDEAFERAYETVAGRVVRLAETVTSERESMSLARQHQRPDIELDQQLALKAAATSLEKRFAGVFGVETIERFLHSSYEEFAGRAVTTTWLPLLAERFAKIRLSALAKVEGKITDERPTVLFLCVHNAGRSQMAMGFFAHYAGDRAVAWSGGSEPGTQVNPAAIEAMAEVGIDISTEFPKPWTDEIVRAADVVITMGCGDACPIFPGKRYEDWVLDDPAGLGVEAVRPIRDEIESRVQSLLADLDVSVPAT